MEEKITTARVIAEYKGFYKVKNADGEYSARVTGKQMFNASSREDYPVVGDFVSVTELNAEQAVIDEILPRKTFIKRNRGGKAQIISANIDVAFIVESIDRDFNLNRLERYFVLANAGGVKSVVVLNKIDLIPQEELAAKLKEIKNRFKEIEVIETSTLSGSGMQELEKYIEKGKTYCFLGSSGVGKSSLINKILGKDVIRTESISIGTGRGKHTTTGREMYFLESGVIVIDNPGMREVGMSDADAGVDSFFAEISSLGKRCKFDDCKHISEPGCEVLAALNSGHLDAEKYSNYINLKKESEYYEMNDLEKREKDRKFGKSLKIYKKRFGRHEM